MSGFAVVYDKQDPVELEILINKIRHRGPFFSGKFQNDRVLMAQNYLEADIPLIKGDAIQMDIPVLDSPSSNHRICYDGQIGNWQALVNTHCPDIFDGPFREEQLILQLYRRYGSRIFEYLDDAIFAFVISDGESLFAARDLLGIKTLYYGRKKATHGRGYRAHRHRHRFVPTGKEPGDRCRGGLSTRGKRLSCRLSVPAGIRLSRTGEHTARPRHGHHPQPRRHRCQPRQRC